MMMMFSASVFLQKKKTAMNGTKVLFLNEVLHRGLVVREFLLVIIKILLVGSTPFF
jgi:hypothetical protein